MSATPLPWFKLFTGIRTHRKTRRLNALLGISNGHHYVIDCLLTVAESFPSGVLEGRGVGDLLEREAGWPGKRGALVRTLVEVEFLDVEGNTLVWHHWEKEQGAHVRKVMADRKHPDGRNYKRKTAIPRGMLEGDSRDSLGSFEGSSRAEKRVEREDREAETTPPNPLKGGAGADADASPAAAAVEKPRASKAGKGKQLPPPSPEMLDAFAHWQRVCGHPKAEFSAERQRAVREAVERWGLVRVKRAFDGVPLDPWNERRLHDCPTIVLRDASRFEKFEALANGQQEIPAPPRVEIPEMPDTPAGIRWALVLEGFHARGALDTVRHLSEARPVRIEGDTLVLVSPDKFRATHHREMYARAVEEELRLVADEVPSAEPVRRVRFDVAGLQAAGGKP